MEFYYIQDAICWLVNETNLMPNDADDFVKAVLKIKNKE